MPFPLDRSHIDSLESELGAKLPACYVAFMMSNNGGTVDLADDDWELYPIRDTTDRKRIARSANHVLKEQVRYQSWSSSVPKTLSIATNACGDQLVLKRTDGSYLPEIYRWNHETGELMLCAACINEAIRE